MRRSLMASVQAENWHRTLIRQFNCALVVVCAMAVRSDAKEPAPFHIQAHRGAGNAFPENTLESFRWAWAQGVTPESDLRTTKDGTIVCFHDPNLKRVPYKIDD